MIFKEKKSNRAQSINFDSSASVSSDKTPWETDVIVKRRFNAEICLLPWPAKIGKQTYWELISDISASGECHISESISKSSQGQSKCAET
ncbi:hypothetical protein J6590_012322 [Homalodisca vitripennis]|nr:hypothetical protein J6590_012322 [Homalodisca vitripennis]